MYHHHKICTYLIKYINKKNIIDILHFLSCGHSLSAPCIENRVLVQLTMNGKTFLFFIPIHCGATVRACIITVAHVLLIHDEMTSGTFKHHFYIILIFIIFHHPG